MTRLTNLNSKLEPFLDNKDNEGAHVQSSYMNITDNNMNATNATADIDIPYDDFVAENETEKGGEYLLVI